LSFRIVIIYLTDSNKTWSKNLSNNQC
jgi:hypothetical protein